MKIRSSFLFTLISLSFLFSGSVYSAPVAKSAIDTESVRVISPRYVATTESQPVEFFIGAYVAYGNPVLSIANLPPGATFDPASGYFQWTPPVGTAPAGQFLEVPLEVNVHSDQAPILSTTYTVTIVVYAK